MFGKEFPTPTVLESSKDYVRQIISTQIQYTGDRSDIVPLKNSESKDRYFQYQNTVNAGDFIPSQKVISNAIQKTGQDYRIETNGPHPIEMLRDRKSSVSQTELIKEMMKK